MNHVKAISMMGIGTALATLLACQGGDWSYREYGGYRGASSSGTSSGHSSSDRGRGLDGGADDFARPLFDPACVDERGFDGEGCFACPPRTSAELLNACTKSGYERFSNTDRIPSFDPEDPRPRPPSLGPARPPFEGEADDPIDTLPPAPPCPVDSRPNPVMVIGATGFPLETIAKAMGPSTTIFYLEKSSCDGVASVLLGDLEMHGEVVFFDASGRKNRCQLTESRPADIGLSALFAETCGGASGLASPVVLPGDVKDFVGPASTVMFTVPATSAERAISAEAAYRVYGFGDRSDVAPWTNENYVFRRGPSSGNQQTVALSLGLPADSFRGRDSSGSSNMLHAIRTSSQPKKTIGISSSEIVDVNRDVLKSLAYRHYTQPVAFYPDSDPATLDRRNVRDGHYFLWLPLHVFARTRSGEPVAAGATAGATRDAAVKRLVYVMTSRQEPVVKSVDLLGALKRIGNVPPCAMHVKRAREAAPLEPSTPAVSCDCAFEASAPGTTSPECKPCESSLDCSGRRPLCSFGFCEEAH